MIDNLKEVFLAIPMLMLSVTVTLNILEYMQILLNLPLPACIYKYSLDQSNLSYIVVPIKKAEFEDLIFVISSACTISDIFKVMIFVGLIDKITEMFKHLRSRLFEYIRKTRRPNVIIWTFFANLTAESQTRFL